MSTQARHGDPVRIGLNGFGRIGRSVTRAALSHPGIEIVGINDIMDADDMRYLLAYDSVHGRLDVELQDETLLVNDSRLPTFTKRSPAELPWEELDVDVALECTGLFRTYEEASAHLEAGADTTLISAPPKGDRDILQIVYGVNHEQYAGEHVVSNASCTTNSVAPVVNVLDEAFGIDRGLLTTVHAYTNTQELLDGPSGKRRRGRAAAENIVPTTTGAARATTEVLPHLAGRLDGMAIRVPIPNGSVSDLTMSLQSSPSRDAINETLREAAQNELNGVLGYTNEQIVSRDIVGMPHSAVMDLSATMRLEDGFIKVLAWYDNEFGFSQRMLDVAEYVTVGHATPDRTAIAPAD